MYNIIRKDWQVNWTSFSFMVLGFVTVAMFIDASFITGIVVFGLVLTAILPLIIWARDWESKDRTLVCSLPIDRSIFVQGRMLSSWTFILAILLAIFLVALTKAYFDGGSLQFADVIQLKGILISLWVPTIVIFLFLPICSRFSGLTALRLFFEVIFVLALIQLFFPNILQSIFANVDEPLQIAFFQRVLQFINDLHGTSTKLFLSGLLLIPVNILALKISEFMFARNNLVT